MYNAIELCHCTGNRLFEQNKNAESAFYVAKIHLKESKLSMSHPMPTTTFTERKSPFTGAKSWSVGDHLTLI